MYLIQMLLPIQDNRGRHFSRADYDRVRRELTETYGGATAFLRSPAKGLWKDESEVNHDEVVMIEVMTEGLERQRWAEYRQELQRRFQQDALVIRATLLDWL